MDILDRGERIPNACAPAIQALKIDYKAWLAAMFQDESGGCAPRSGKIKSPNYSLLFKVSNHFTTIIFHSRGNTTAHAAINRFCPSSDKNLYWFNCSIIRNTAQAVPKGKGVINKKGLFDEITLFNELQFPIRRRG